MTNIVLLDSKIHADLKIQATPSAKLGDAQRFVPVAVGEFAHLVAYYPILFSKDAETGAFYCGVMLGIDEGENLFLPEGRDIYRPLNLQRGPFFTAGGNIAIDLDHPRVGTSGHSIFEAGEPSPYLNGIIGLFRELKPALEQTKIFVDTLLDSKLIEPIDISLSFDDGSRRQLEGLYTVNQDRMKNLADGKVVEFFQRGYLQAMYTMIASLKQIPALAMRKNALLAR